MQRLTASAVQAPEPLPAFKRNISLIRRGLGNNAEQVLATEEGRTTVAGLITGGDVDVKPARVVANIARAVSLPAGNAAVRFDSPLSQNTWEAVLSATRPRQQTPVSVGSAMRDAARRMIMNPAFGDRFAAAFRQNLQARVRSAAGRAVTVAGSSIGTVDVHHNVIDGFVEGVHIAGSVRGGPATAAVRATGVRVSSNTVVLAVPVELTRAPRAVFVGSANRISVLDNSVSASVSQQGAGRALAGIQIEGTFGGHLVVRDNLLDDCDTGVLIRRHGDIPRGLWLVADNVAPSARVGVDGTNTVQATGNVPNP